MVECGSVPFRGANCRWPAALGRWAESLDFPPLLVNDSRVNLGIEALTMLAAPAPVTERAVHGTGALLPALRAQAPPRLEGLSPWSASDSPRS